MFRLRVLMVLSAVASCFAFVPTAPAEDITWGGIADDDWHILGNWNAYWDPWPNITQRVPTDGDTATLSDDTWGSVVTLSDHTDWIDGLTVENGFTLATEGYLLGVDDGGSGVTRIDGTDSRIIVDELSVNPNSRGFDTDILHLFNGGKLWMNDGLAHIDIDAYVGATCEIHGSGTVQFIASSGTALVNDGAIRVSGVGDATLTIDAPNGAELDLDGNFISGREWGVLDVNDGTGVFSGSKTLIIDAPLAEEFSGDIYIGQGDKIDFRETWNQDRGTINFYGGNIHSEWATLKAHTMGAVDATINVHSGVAVLDTATFLATGTTIDVDATLQVEGLVGLLPSCELDLNDADALIVNGSLAVNQTVIDLDGDSPGDNTIRVNSSGTLTLNVDSVDDDAVPNQFDGTMEILGMVNANVDGGWTNDGTVHLYNGELTGTAVTNTGQIRGYGSVTTDGLVNNDTISADGGTLILDSPSDNMDLDGTSDNGVLYAVDGNLEIREGNVMFNGTAGVGSGKSILVDGNLTVDDNTGPGLIQLNGGMVIATGLFDLRGNLTATSGTSRIAANSVVFRPGSDTTISGSLLLDPTFDSYFYTGANVSGTGIIHNPVNRTVWVDENVVVEVHLQNDGRLHPGWSPANVTGSATVESYKQTATGALRIEIGGLADFEFDQLIVMETADLDGELELDLVDLGAGLFEPEVGNSWEILTAANVNGEFFGGIDDTLAPLPAGTFWDLIYNPTNVILQVIAGFTADFNLDGDVDGDDFLIWQAGFQVDDRGDADGDGDTDGDDFLIWQTQFGSEPGSGSTAVPEPAAIALVMLLLASVVTMRKALG